MLNRIFLFQQREWSIRIGNRLAERLAAEHFELGCLTFKRTVHNTIINNTNIKYSLVISHDEILEKPKNYIEDRFFTLKDLCRELNIDSIWKIIYSARHHVKNYNKKYYYSYFQNKTDRDIEDYIKSLYFICKKVENEFNPSIIFAPNFVSLPHIVFNLYFKKKGIKMLGISDSKVGTQQIFVNDYLDDTGCFHDYINEIENKKKQIKNKKLIEDFINLHNSGKISYLTTLDKISVKSEIKFFIKTFLSLIKSFIYKDINHIKNLGYTIDSQKPFLIMRDYLSNIRNKLMEKLIKYDDFREEEEFAFMPIQVQPESSIDVQSVAFSNQIEMARQIAMHLPGDMKLYVKDHPFMYGLRNFSYLKKLQNTPNVKLINFRIDAKKIIQKSSIIICSTGTIIFQAALLNKFCIMFGKTGTLKRLPNVFYLNSFEGLTRKINELKNKKIDKEDYNTRLYNYIEASFQTGFDNNYLNIWEKNAISDLEIICDKIIREIKRNLGQ
jgi:hypothetical protein